MSSEDGHDSVRQVIDELGAAFLEQDLRSLENLLMKTFDEIEPYLVLQSKKQLVHASGSLEKSILDDDLDSKWIVIESLSRLRQVVGGRFDNIKRKWGAAGFPLKDHRGSQVDQVTVNQEGWVELCNWMIGQGYESRILPDNENGFFEVRSMRDK